MEHDKPLPGRSHECRNVPAREVKSNISQKTNSVVVLDRSPLIELVDDLEVAVVGTDHVLVDEVEGGVRDELV